MTSRRKVDHEGCAGGARALCELYQRRRFSAASGPFENDATALRQYLVDLLKRQHVGRLRAIRIKPHRCKIDKRMSLCSCQPRSS